MALYRCGGGGGGASTLITKNITQNGTYNASADNADGYSSVTVDVDKGAIINTPAEWDALTLTQKREQGLTVIREYNGQPNGIWRDLSSSVLDIIKEFFNYTTETIPIAEQRLNHLIYFQGKWKDGGAWDSTLINHSNLSYDSVDTGTIEVNYSGFNNKLITILHDVTIGYNASFTVANGYYGVTDGGAIIGVPFNSDVELIGEYYGDSSQTFITDEVYDLVLFLSNKWSYSGNTSNGIYTISDGTLVQTGNITLPYSGSDNHMVAVYENVPSGTSITLGNGKSGIEDAVVAIGIKEIVS